MLMHLRIRDFAVIDECSVDFASGFVALTGETGAGKSILIDALSACLGARMGPDVIRAGSQRATIEAVFARTGERDAIGEALAGAGVEDGEVLILSREIHAAGRSVCRANGTAVPAALLSTLGSGLVDLHGQSEHLSLLKPARQLDMIDHFGGLDALRSRFAAEASALQDARGRLRDLTSNRQAAEQRADLLRFQVKEIEDAAPVEGEDETLMAERTRLANAEKLAGLATEALDHLDGDDLRAAAADGLRSASASLRQLAAIDPSMTGAQETVEELNFSLVDLAGTVRRYRDSIEFDPARLAEVEARLDELNRLRRKYGQTISEVLAFLDEARKGLDQVDNFETALAAAEEAVRATEERAGATAADLSSARHEAAERFVAQVRERLAKLSLGPAHFQVNLTRSPSADGLPVDDSRVAFTNSGIDQIQFLVSFNAGESPRPIERVASGGETARFMLAVKATLAASDDVPTLIFDEIDTGVGGRSGATVAAMLVELARSHQVISITHLPQLASAAQQHLKIAKHERDGATTTTVQDLTGDQRIQEVAEMLSGAQPTQSAIDTARDLLATSPAAR